MVAELVQWKTQKLAINVLRQGAVQRGMELARLESNDPETPMEIPLEITPLPHR
jgi:hypothetical protein